MATQSLTAHALKGDTKVGEMTYEGLSLDASYDITTYHGLPVIALDDGDGKLVIPHERSTHPAIDYEVYSSANAPIIYRSNKLSENFNQWILEIEEKGGIEKFLWYTIEQLADQSESEYSLTYAKYFFNRVTIPARISTLSAHDDLAEWDDWLYRCYALGYDLEIIARTLGISMIKFYEYYSNFKKVELAKQQRANDTVDAMEQMHRQILRGDHKTKEGRTELSSKISAIAMTGAWATLSAKAYISAYNPVHKVQEVPFIPSVNINTEVVGNG
jgi:hypothetical protein